MFYKFICYILVKKHQYVAFKNLQLNSLLPESRVPGNTGVPPWGIQSLGKVEGYSHLHHLTPRGSSGSSCPPLQAASLLPSYKWSLKSFTPSPLRSQHSELVLTLLSSAMLCFGEQPPTLSASLPRDSCPALPCLEALRFIAGSLTLFLQGLGHRVTLSLTVVILSPILLVCPLSLRPWTPADWQIPRPHSEDFHILSFLCQTHAPMELVPTRNRHSFQHLRERSNPRKPSFFQFLAHLFPRFLGWMFLGSKK